MKRFQYTPEGTCSRLMEFSLDDNGAVHDVCVTGGCHGNLQGIGRLVEGMDARDAIARMRGICCGRKPTSCPDQLACALERALAD